MNAKKITNKIVKNAYTKKDYGELRKMLGEYEDKIKMLEVQKVKDKHHSEELLKIIGKLSNQKAALTDKLFDAPLSVINATNATPEQEEKVRDTLFCSAGGRSNLLEAAKQGKRSVKQVIDQEEYITRRTKHLKDQCAFLKKKQRSDKGKITDYRRRLHKTREGLTIYKTRVTGIMKAFKKLEDFCMLIVGKGDLDSLEPKVISKLQEKMFKTYKQLLGESSRRKNYEELLSVLDQQNKNQVMESLGKRKNPVEKGIDDLIPSKRLKTALMMSEQEEELEGLDILDDQNLLDPNFSISCEDYLNNLSRTDDARTRLSVDKTAVIDANELLDRGDMILNNVITIETPEIRSIKVKSAFGSFGSAGKIPELHLKERDTNRAAFNQDSIGKMSIGKQIVKDSSSKVFGAQFTFSRVPLTKKCISDKKVLPKGFYAEVSTEFKSSRKYISID